METTQATDLQDLEKYLKEGGFLKKDCWLKPLHIQYNPATSEIEMVDSISTSDGHRILGVRERFESLSKIPYAGKWVKCTKRGDLI